MSSPGQRSTVASAHKAPAIKLTRPVRSSTLPTTSTKRTSTNLSSTRPPAQIKKPSSVVPAKKASPVNVPRRGRSSSVAVSVISKTSPAPVKSAVSQSLPTPPTVARTLRSAAPSSTTSSPEKEDRMSRLTRPTRSSSQKTVDSSSRSAPKRAPGLPRVASATGNDAGKKSRSTSVVKPASTSTKSSMSGSRHGNGTPRPTACKNAALASTSKKTSASPRSVSPVKKADEPAASDVQRDQVADVKPATGDVPVANAPELIASTEPVCSTYAEADLPTAQVTTLEEAAATTHNEHIGTDSIGDVPEAEVLGDEIIASELKTVDGQTGESPADISEKDVPEGVCEVQGEENDVIKCEQHVEDCTDSDGLHIEDKIEGGDEDQASNSIDARELHGEITHDEMVSMESESKSDIAAAESLSDVIQYYSESSSEDTMTSDDSETSPSESTSFGSLVGAYSGSSDSEENVPSVTTFGSTGIVASSSSLGSLLEAYSGSTSDSDTSTDDSTTTPTEDGPCSSYTDESINTCATSPPASPTIPDKLVFHPSHNPEDFLRVPEWAYEIRLSRRASASRDKLKLPLVKPLRIAPKPPITKAPKGWASSLQVVGSGNSPSTARKDVQQGEVPRSRDVHGTFTNSLRFAPPPVALDIASLLCEIQDDDKIPISPRVTASHSAATCSPRAVDPLDEHFAHDPFLESLRWLYTSRIQLWRSEVIGDDDDDDDDEEQATDEDFDAIASRMAARVATWRPTDKDIPVAKEFRESVVQLQALVSEIEQELGLPAEGLLTQVSTNDVRDTVACATIVGSDAQSGFSGNNLTSATVEEKTNILTVDEEQQESPRLTAVQKGKARATDQPETSSTVMTTQTICDSKIDATDFIDDEDTSGETFLSYLPLPETPKFLLGGTWSLVVLPSAGYTSPSSRSHHSFGKLHARFLRSTSESLPDATTSYWHISGSNSQLPGTQKAVAATSISRSHASKSGPTVLVDSPSSSEGAAADSAGVWAKWFGRRSVSSSSNDATVSPASCVRAPVGPPETLPPPSPVVSEASTDDSDGTASETSAGSPMLSGHDVPVRPPLSTVGKGSGFKSLFSRWF